ncbi:MAG: toll/interleukin-1 receptor domain-containing protein [Desulfobaccales bacterium]
MSKPEEQRVQVFICYSHSDKKWLERLKVHLTPLRRDHEVDFWEDTRIRPGSKWRDEIRVAVEQANIAVLIISADFLASDFIRTDELPPLLKAAEEEGALILPIIASPSLFLRNPDISQFQAVNSPSNPLVSASIGDQEATFVKVAEAILENAVDARQSAVTKFARPDEERREIFLEHATWSRLIKIGDWIFDQDIGRIIGSGMHAYLLSRTEYGRTPFVINATLVFTNFSQPNEGTLGMNAGIVFGWKEEKQAPRYYNILLTGSEILVERVGFHGEEAYRGYEHITDKTPMKIESGLPVEFTVSVQAERIDIFANGSLIQSLKRPSGVVGRVGIRPWRSKMDCTKFVVFEHRTTVE